MNDCRFSAGSKTSNSSRKDAARSPGMSLRQVHRMRVDTADGDKGLVHRGRGRVSPRRTDEQERLKALELYRSMYRSRPTFFAEKLDRCTGIRPRHGSPVADRRGLLEKPRRG